MQTLVRTLRELFGIPAPDDPARWHKWDLTFPVRGIDGRLLFFAVWRRRGLHGWEYKERQETLDEFYDRQW
jgi:hypothetical protein